MLFLTFYETRPELHRWVAIATLFIPSVIFWGSGLLKDTVTLASVGIITYLVKRIFIHRKLNILNIILLVLFFYITYSVKKYILLCYLPAILFLIFTSHLNRIRSGVLKLMLLPVVLMSIAVTAYFAVIQVSEDDVRYDLSVIGQTAKTTAYDIAFQTGHEAGSTYSLGELDGSFDGMLSLAPQAINVSLFRPYLWEVTNPLMLMSALESLLILGFTIYIFFWNFRFLPSRLADSEVLFCLVFSLTFAFAVGVSTFNFGTLSRYKIPMLPFYTLALVFVHKSKKREMKVGELATTE
jgi:hypothetical protein